MFNLSRNRITCDEEERMKLGYCILTSYEINTFLSGIRKSKATSEGVDLNDLQPGSHDISDKSGMAKKRDSQKDSFWMSTAGIGREMIMKT